MTSSKSDVGAPYLPWTTFEKFLKSLKEKGTVPPRIDGSLLRTYSGTAQSQLRGALRFFGLVAGEADHTTPEMAAWVEAVAQPEKWKATLRRTVPEKYSGIVSGVDIQAGTQAQLEEAFRTKGGTTGSAKKAARFYLTAMNAAGLSHSPYFVSVRAGKVGSPSGPGTHSGRKRTRRRSSSNASTDGAGMETPAPEGTRRIDLPIPGGIVATIWWPVNLDEAEEQFAIQTLTQYLEIERGKKAGKEAASA